MANSGSNHSQSFRPHVDIQDAWELSQDPEAHYAYPPSAQAGLVTHAVNEAVMHHRAQRATHAPGIDQNPNRGLISARPTSQWKQAYMSQQPNRGLIGTRPTSQWQQAYMSQQPRPTQQPQTPSWGQKGPQAGQMQQPPYHSGQQYTRPSGINPSSSSYPSNTSRRAQNQPPKPSRSSSDTGAAAPAYHQGPMFNSEPNILNGILGTSHSHPEQPQIAYPPSGNTVMPAASRKYSSKSAISPALLRPSHARATPGMLNSSNISNPEQPAAFMPYSPLAAPQHGKNGRNGSYAREVVNPLTQITRVEWPDELPPVENPPEAQAPTAKRQRLQHRTKRAANPSNGTPNFSKYAHRSHSRAHIRMRNDLVESINAEDAAIKESYDPATIARDVLINADKHPTEPILNHHLEILLQKIPSVNITSDLTTLRWDLLDPEDPRDTPQVSPAPSRPNALGAQPSVPPSYHSRQLPLSPAPAPAHAPASAPPPALPQWRRAVNASLRNRGWIQPSWPWSRAYVILSHAVQPLGSVDSSTMPPRPNC